MNGKKALELMPIIVLALASISLMLANITFFVYAQDQSVVANTPTNSQGTNATSEPKLEVKNSISNNDTTNRLNTIQSFTNQFNHLQPPAEPLP